jgi:hypothetical protein
MQWMGVLTGERLSLYIVLDDNTQDVWLVDVQLHITKQRRHVL